MAAEVLVSAYVDGAGYAASLEISCAWFEVVKDLGSSAFVERGEPIISVFEGLNVV